MFVRRSPESSLEKVVVVLLWGGWLAGMEVLLKTIVGLPWR